MKNQNQDSAENEKDEFSSGKLVYVFNDTLMTIGNLQTYDSELQESHLAISIVDRELDRSRQRVVLLSSVMN